MARKSKKRIRISGLVSLMNRAREGLATGVAESELPAFRRMVSDAVSFVERSCRESGVSPQDLPAPSRRAYQYLKCIDLRNIPVRAETEGLGRKTIRISNVISSCTSFQQEFASYAYKAVVPATGKRPRGEPLAVLHARICALVSQIEEVLERFEAGPSAFPDPTRRAYQWLKYLSDGGAFERHVGALRMAYEIAPRAHVEFYNLAGLYRTKMQDGVPHVTANEAFVCAPKTIIQALMRAATGKARGKGKLRVQQYAQTEEFRESRLDIEMIGIQPQGDAQGAQYDLREVFDRVNESSFRGRMEPPNLTWNKTITHAKLGHYLPGTDTVMISIALDSDAVPAYVIDHVMHHELLHRKLGVRFVNGRRMSHTAEFKARERAFEGYAQAVSFLRDMSSELR